MGHAIALRAPVPSDVEALVALQREEQGTAAPMNADALRLALFDEARGHGAQVRIAVEGGATGGEAGGAIAGAVAWVIGPGVMFASPFIAPGGAAATALLDALFAEVGRHGATSARTSTGAMGSPRAAALVARGFAPCFDFVDVTRPTAGVVAAPPPAGTSLVALARIDRARFLALYNLTFDGVPNALPLSPAQLDEVLDGPLAFAAGTGALVDETGAYVGFLHADRQIDRAGEHVTVEAVGVAPAWRGGRGVGAWLVERLLIAGAAAGVPEARALIASTNPASVKLHARLGFVERFRRHVWEWRAA